MNAAAEMLLDMSFNQVQGQSCGKLFQEDSRFLAALARVRETRHPLTEREMHIVIHSVARATVDCIMTPVGDRAGNNGILVEVIGLDRHRQITRESQLVADGEAARLVVRGLAHEIRNPLGGLRGAAQLLEREIGESRLTEYTQVIIREADRLQRLLDRMLGPRAVPRMRPTNVHEVTEHVCALIAAEAPASLKLIRDYDPSIPDLYADAELLIQATLNVARNAVQMSPATDGVVTVRTRIHRQFTIGAHRHKLVVRVDVQDNGPGIAPELREKIFFPMVTGREEGTGLGLSIAQSIVNQHGGLIECESQPGATTFSILLPVQYPKCEPEANIQGLRTIES